MLVELDDCEECDGQYFKPFSDDLVLREVYIGAKSSICALGVKAAVDRLGDVRVFTTRRAFQEFRVVKNGGPW